MPKTHAETLSITGCPVISLKAWQAPIYHQIRQIHLELRAAVFANRLVSLSLVFDNGVQQEKCQLLPEM
jgi:hypothetical protein